jgi:type I restriction enzyme S subunit
MKKPADRSPDGAQRNPGAPAPDSAADAAASELLATLNNKNAFQTLNGLWKGKTPPFTRAVVVRNTNFTNDGILDLSDVAELDVETKQLASRQLRSGDIIVERSGGGPKQPVGRICLFEGGGSLPHSFSNFTSVIRVLDRDRLLTRYVLYFLMHLYKSGYTEGLQHATTGIRNLDFSSYLEVGVPLLPKPEQQKIAAILWKLQRAIATQDRLIAATRDLKHSAMQHLFTHGLRGESLKETEIGQMPESWDPVPLGKHASVGSGGTPSRTNPAYWHNGSIPWVKTGEVDYCVIEDAEEKITPLALQESATRIFPKGTLLLAMYGQGITRGKVAILGIEAATNQACAAIRPLDDQLRSDFLYCTLTYGYERLRGLAHGGQQQNLNADLIRRFVFGLPSDVDEQRDIAAALATLDRKLAHHQRKRAALNDLFQTLLHQLMTARIRVADLDIDTSEVANHFVDPNKMVDATEASHMSDHLADANKSDGRETRSNQRSRPR